jgi:hypothetical protein
MENWRDNLNTFLNGEAEKKQRKEENVAQNRAQIEPIIAEFYSSKVGPAFEELKTELEKHGKRVKLWEMPQWEIDPTTLEKHLIGDTMTQTINVYSDPEETHFEFGYSIRAEIVSKGACVYQEIDMIDKRTGKRSTSQPPFSQEKDPSRLYRAPHQFSGQDVSNLTKEEILQNFVDQYKRSL